MPFAVKCTARLSRVDNMADAPANDAAVVRLVVVVVVVAAALVVVKARSRCVCVAVSRGPRIFQVS